MNFSENAVLSYDVRTKSIKVVDQGITSYYSITSKGGVTIEYSNNHLNINGFGLTQPVVSTHSYVVNPPFVPYIEWNKLEGEIKVGTRINTKGEIPGEIGTVVITGHIGTVVITGHFIGVDTERGNYGVKISMSNQILKVEQGFVSAMEG